MQDYALIVTKAVQSDDQVLDSVDEDSGDESIDSASDSGEDET